MPNRVQRRTRGTNVIQFTRPSPGAPAEERVVAYGDALLATERALNEFADDLSEHTKELIVLRKLLDDERVQLREDRAQAAADRKKGEADAKQVDRRFEGLDTRLGHIETMLEALLRSGGHPLPEMRERAPSVHDVEEAAARGTERALERRTPVTAFQVPGLPPGYVPQPTGLTSDRVKEIVTGTNVLAERDELRTAAEKRGDAYRNIIIGIAIFVGGPATVWALYHLMTAAVHAP